MLCKLTHNDTDAIVTANADPQFVYKIIEQVNWLLHIYKFRECSAEKDITILLCEIRTKIPGITAVDIISVKSVCKPEDDAFVQFVNICNVIAKAPIFEIQDCTVFTI